LIEAQEMVRICGLGACVVETLHGVGPTVPVTGNDFLIFNIYHNMKDGCSVSHNIVLEYLTYGTAVSSDAQMLVSDYNKI